MIKKYNQYIKESILDELKGPSEEEVKKFILNMTDPINQLIKSIEIEYIDGIKLAIEKGVDFQYITSENIIKMIELINPSDAEIIDYFKNREPKYSFNILIRIGRLELAKRYANSDNSVIHFANDRAMKFATLNNNYDIVKYLFTLDDFDLDVLHQGWKTTTDKKIKKILEFHMDNLHIDGLLFACEHDELDLVEDMLRRYHFTNEGIKKCIKVTTNESIIDLLEECLR